MTTTSSTRRQEIGQTIVAAMKQVDVDWTRESEAITSAQNEMEETMALYCENKASKADVKASYQAWVKTHRGGL